ncbi:hypothetical protein AYO40_00915 [Planctomycetaceae bacterium SCGC AG-212-D15]|nr:hypothetical protein AYO40_00915 [Planctomycetaceae bacterium SCGC AG-212-D15]
MSRSPIGSVLHYIHRLVDRHGPAASTDRDLLARFIAQRDEAAFEAIVRRHGPMVLAACRRLLGDADAAEDAFQATFLVLVRKAPAVARPDHLAGWLHGVATRIASKARHDRLRRTTAPLDPEIPAAEEAMDDVMRRELATVLDEEVARLPATYQTPFVLCHLAGRSNEEAARELGCPTGTIYSRLARAREMLRVRLCRRGLVLSAGTLAAGLHSTTAPASVPVVLLQQTVSSGVLLAAGQTLGAGLVSAQTLSFMEASLHAMYLAQLKWTSAAVLLIVAVGASLGVAYREFGGAAAAAPALAAAADPADKPAPDPNEKLRQELKSLQDRLKAIQDKQQLEAEMKKLRAQLEALEGKGDTKLPAVTYKGESVEHWLKTLRDCDPTTRLNALRAMAAIGEELGDDAPRVAVAITGILKTNGTASLIPEGLPVEGVATAAHPAQVQLQAIAALAAIGPAARSAVPKLVTMQLDELNAVHGALNAVADAPGGGFGGMGLPPADPNEDGDTRGPINNAIVRIDPDGKQAVPLLLAAIQKPNLKKHVAVNAANALAAYQDRAAPAAVAVVNLLRIDDDVVRQAAYKALKEMGEAVKPMAMPALLALAKGNDKNTATAAAGVLWGLWAEEAEKAGIPKTEPPGGAAPPA